MSMNHTMQIENPPNTIPVVATRLRLILHFESESACDNPDHEALGLTDSVLRDACEMQGDLTTKRARLHLRFLFARRSGFSDPDPQVSMTKHLVSLTVSK